MSTKKKKSFFLLVLAASALILAIFLVFFPQFLPQISRTANEIEATADFEYFWGEGCPHCANVDEFLSGWEGSESLNLEKYEIYKNPSNAQRLKTRAKDCDLPSNQVGVPLLFAKDGQCVVGDMPIIEYFKNYSK